jgi:hypothetical protein
LSVFLLVPSFLVFLWSSLCDFASFFFVFLCDLKLPRAWILHPELTAQKFTTTVMIKLYQFCCYLLILSGIAHLFLTFHQYHQLSHHSFRFSGGALLAFILAIFNLVETGRETYSRKEKLAWIVANFLSAVFLCLGFYLMREFKSCMLALLGIFLLAGTIYLSTRRAQKK